MKFEIIEDKEQLYDKCENMEQLYDKYYYPLLVENQSLKKQLEEYKLITIDYQELEARNKDLENQQKEFIKLLEKEIVDSKAGSSQQYYVKEHLRLFKEIIGVSNEKV